ncbi:MAG TPA: YdcF family protein, partial [Longimicrobium sp.]|nr:YdcF family protein [Longimicrobium sp.]
MSRLAPARRTARRLLAGAACATVLWGAVLAWRIAAYGARHDPHRADAAIVLGAAVQGAEPSPVFAARIDHAVALYRRGRVARLVFTGGVGAGDTLAEAEVARRRAVRAGVPAERIAIETRSTITYENLVE